MCTRWKTSNKSQTYLAVFLESQEPTLVIFVPTYDSTYLVTYLVTCLPARLPEKEYKLHSRAIQCSHHGLLTEEVWSGLPQLHELIIILFVEQLDFVFFVFFVVIRLVGFPGSLWTIINPPPGFPHFLLVRDLIWFVGHPCGRTGVQRDWEKTDKQGLELMLLHEEREDMGSHDLGTEGFDETRATRLEVHHYMGVHVSKFKRQRQRNHQWRLLWLRVE